MQTTMEKKSKRGTALWIRLRLRFLTPLMVLCFSPKAKQSFTQVKSELFSNSTATAHLLLGQDSSGRPRFGPRFLTNNVLKTGSLNQDRKASLYQFDPSKMCFICRFIALVLLASMCFANTVMCLIGWKQNKNEISMQVCNLIPKEHIDFMNLVVRVFSQQTSYRRWHVHLLFSIVSFCMNLLPSTVTEIAGEEPRIDR